MLLLFSTAVLAQSRSVEDNADRGFRVDCANLVMWMDCCDQERGTTKDECFVAIQGEATPLCRRQGRRKIWREGNDLGQIMPRKEEVEGPETIRISVVGI